MSSITTAIPSGPVNTSPLGPSYTGANWCIQGLISIFGDDYPPYTYNECANTTLHESAATFETICCDGSIIDTSYNLWGQRNISSYRLDIENLVCCRAGGQRLMGGISPIDSDYTHCSDRNMVPTPLASLAATNSKNAALYTLVYESASEDASGNVGDWTVTQTPTCLWVQTGGVEVPMTTVTVEAARITTLPLPTTDEFGYTIDYGTRSGVTGVSVGDRSRSEASGASAERTASSAVSSATAARATSGSSRNSISRVAMLPLFLLAAGWGLC